ncbi:hypothetical protein V499_06849 [Pseudogymnoascus sp. VKM F-103]|nr:hypothetical protein V499_06849 [Pseudogymnoascus sp. VKM F-103]
MGYVNWLAAGSRAITDGLSKSRVRLSEDDHQIPHGDFDGVQPVLSKSEDCTTIPLILARKCARNYEDQYQDSAQDVEGEELCSGQIQGWKGDETRFRAAWHQGRDGGVG